MARPIAYLIRKFLHFIAYDGVTDTLFFSFLFFFLITNKTNTSKKLSNVKNYLPVVESDLYVSILIYNQLKNLSIINNNLQIRLGTFIIY